MAGTHRFQDQAYILHTRAFRNTSLLVDVLSREHGRLSLVAKGAKRGSAPVSANLQPYQLVHLEWGGQNELQTLYKAEMDTRSRQLLSGDALYHGFYLNELLIRLLHRHDPHPVLFDDYSACLHALVMTEQKDIPLRYFELQLLESLGYAVNLQMEIQTDSPVDKDRDYYYLIEQGPIAITGVSMDALQVSGATLLALAEHSLSLDTHRNEAKRLMRAILDHYLGDRPLKARELMQSRKLLRRSTSKRG